MHDSRQVAEANGLADAMGLGGFPPPTPPTPPEFWHRWIEDTNQGILKAAREHDLAGTAQWGQRALNRTCAWISATSQRSVFSFGVRVLVLVLCQFFILLYYDYSNYTVLLYNLYCTAINTCMGLSERIKLCNIG